MVAQKPVDVALLTVFCFIPPVWLYSFYRIEMLSKGLFLLFIAIAISMVIQLTLPFPYGLIFAFVPYVAIPIYPIRKWAKEWNAKFEAEGF